MYDSNLALSSIMGVVPTLDLAKVFAGAPIIYSLLFILSLFSCALCIYSLITLRLSEMMPEEFTATLRSKLTRGDFEAALASCQDNDSMTARVVAAGLAARKHGSQVMIDAMVAEGRRLGGALWQRISLLNDVVVIAPMLGLLGTVLGMFFAFYDTAQTQESLTAIFDGLGIAIGTTVTGLIVAILAMASYTLLKFRVMSILSTIENESLSLANLVQMERAH